MAFLPTLNLARSAAMLLAGVGLAWSDAGCGTEDSPLLLSSSSTTTSVGSGGAGGGGAVANQGKELFDALEPILVKECGPCHTTGGPADTPFLGDPDSKMPDPYTTMTSWPGFLVKSSAKSRLLTHSSSVEHKGTKPSDALVGALEAWLTEEAKAIKDVSKEELPTIPPFKPIVLGFNAVYLGALGENFDGMAVTFLAEELTPSTLSLTEIEVHPTSKFGVKLTHPLFTVFPSGSVDGDPDPVDSFSNVVLELAAGQAGLLGPGLVVLANWKPNARLSLAFETALAVDPNGTVDPNATPCTALDSFKTNAAPKFTPCFACHNGADGAANGAVDMSELMSNPGHACGQILNRVNQMSPAKSQLFVTTNPSGAATHPFKFGGSAANYNAFKSSVTLWINDEAK